MEPIRAIVDTGRFTHQRWKTGDEVWIIEDGEVCGVAASPKVHEPEGYLRRDVLRRINEEKDNWPEILKDRKRGTA